jgi:hypothetical protein
MPEEFIIEYPFVRSTYTEQDEEGMSEVACWKPGVEFVPTGQYGEDVDTVAHGVGKQRLTVISRHRPGKFPERVFYVRQWIDPDGKAFGKPKLRITTACAFTTLCRGYRYHFEVRNIEVPK